MTILVEPATVSAAETLARCGADWFAETFRTMIPQPALDRLVARFEPGEIARRIAGTDETWWWARAGDECVGYAVLTRVEMPAAESEEALAAEPASPVCYAGHEEWARAAPHHDFELARLYVSPKWHRRGLAAQLMQQVRAEAALRGGTRLWLRVHAHNDGARAFYAAQGFGLMQREQLAVENVILPHEILATPLESATTPAATWTIAPARAAEAVDLSAFAIRCFEATFAAFNSRENMDAYLDSALRPTHFRALLESTDASASPPGLRYELWRARRPHVGREPGEIIAYSMLATDEPPPCVGGECPIELRRLYVDHAYHGAGLAQAMMARVMERARIRGAKTIWLGVWERNFRAQAFYQKWGFERVGEKVFVVGDDPQIDWVMARPL
jgi:ribosomal protein S18 acetylase RimI-like enzyme